MVSNRLLNRLTLRVLLPFTALIVIFNEYLIYNINEAYWNNIECLSQNCTRILLVADPQILGETSDDMLFNSVAMVDSDRYLQKTFQRALKFSKPNIVCFLGDLLDEGSTSTQEQFKSYVQRFQNIFHMEDSIKQVHVPGDNDIGGENGEYISNSNIRRFEIEFENNDVFEYNDRIRFFKINRMLYDFSNPDRENNFIHDKLRIGLSHLPILLAGTTYLKNLLNEIDPHIIFSAHWHESRVLTYPSTITSYELYDKRIEVFHLDRLKLKKQYLEIMVPTSSYRMGKNKIGYGLAVIENFTLKYTVLWTFSRFLFLYLYLGWLVLAVVIVLLLQCSLRCSKRLTKKYINAYGRISYLPNSF